MPRWNPWHGCHKLSEGCQNCYVYRMDARFDRDSSVVKKTKQFDLPIQKKRDGSYKIPPGSTLYTCFTSDFLLEDADQWRDEVWAMIRTRKDLTFLFITKRIHRFMQCIPSDWGEGYENVRVYCTMENQRRTNERMPLLKQAPIRHKGIICEPILSPIDLSEHLGPWAREVVAGGESGPNARVCDYDWILALREQCMQHAIPFTFRQTGYRLKKDGTIYVIPRKYQHRQAKKANIDLDGSMEHQGMENHSPS